jgi:hypothetical protein
MAGYFFPGFQFGGLTTNPCTLAPAAPVNQKSSAGLTASCATSASFSCVSARAKNGALDATSATYTSAGNCVALRTHAIVRPSRDSANAVLLCSPTMSCGALASPEPETSTRYSLSRPASVVCT